MTLPEAQFTLVANAVDGIMRLSDPTGGEVPDVDLDPVQNLAVTANGINSQTVGWSYSQTNHEGFEHQLRDTAVDTAWRSSTSLPATARSFEVASGLTPNTTIGHRVRAVAGADASPWFEVWAATEDDYTNPDPPDPGQFVYWKFGADDYTSANPFVIIEPSWDTTWWYNHGDGLGLYDLAFYENINDGNFEWTTGPKAGEDYTTVSRGTKLRKKVAMSVRAGNLPRSGPLYFTIRYKDNLLPGTYGGAPIWSSEGTQVPVGVVGGLNDHRWKTAQFAIDAASLTWSGSNIYIRIGEEYSDDICGQLNIDKIKISTTNNKHEFEPDRPGLWAQLNETNKHANIRNDHQMYRGETPVFRYGMFTERVFDLGADATTTTISTNANDTFQIMENANMNVLIQHMWEAKLDNDWTITGPSFAGTNKAELGTPELMTQCDGHGIQLIQNTLTDVRPYWHQPKANYGYWDNWRQYKDYVSTVEPDWNGDDRLLAMMWFDEADHDASNDKVPIEGMRQFYCNSKNREPDRAVFGTMMGFHWDISWQFYQDVFDVIGNDKYFDDNGTGTWSSLEGGVRDNAYKMLTGRLNTNDGIMQWGVPHATEQAKDQRIYPGGARCPNELEVVMQAYLHIACGMKGICYFRQEHPLSGGYTGLTQMWDGLYRVGDELFGANGIADWLVSPAIEIDVAGLNGIVTTTDVDVWCMMSELSGQKMMFALNGLYSSRTVTFSVPNVSDGTYAVRFEGRAVTVSGGSFTDSFSNWERHVYEFF